MGRESAHLEGKKLTTAEKKSMKKRGVIEGKEGKKE